MNACLRKMKNSTFKQVIKKVEDTKISVLNKLFFEEVGRFQFNE